MSPIPVPPPVTTAERLDTSKSLEALRSSFDLTDGLSEDIVLITVRVGSLGKVLGEKFRAAIEEDAVKSLSMVVLTHDKAMDVGTAS